MNKMSKLVLASCLLTQSLCFAAGESVDRIVAIVNNDVITSAELTHQTELVKQQLRRQKQALPSDMELKKHILQRLVDLNLQVQFAAKAGISISDDELTNTIEKIAGRNHITVEAMKVQLAAENITYAEYRDNLRKDLIVSQLQREAVAKKIQISDEDVQEFMKTQHSSNAQDMLYEIEDSLIPLGENPTSKDLQAARIEANKLLQKLQKGEASAMPKSLGWRSLAELPDVFSKDVMQLSEGQYAGPIRAGNGLHIIKLIGKKSDGSSAQLTDNQARELLFRRQFEDHVEQWLQQLRTRSYVKMMLDEPNNVA